MVKVYAWPPVGVIARNWTMELPTSRSKSIITGQEYVSASQRRRKLATVEVSGRRHYGSGYMEALWRLMDGGVHLVYMTSCRIPWGNVDVYTSVRTRREVEWEEPPAMIGWTYPGADIIWFAPVELPAVYSVVLGVPTLTVSSLPPNALVALPGEFLTIHGPGGEEETIMIANPARSDASGVAAIRLVSVPTISGPVSIGTQEVGVFRLQTDWPRAMRSASQESYTLEFREVFEDETDGFVGVNPWI
ncbi:hypothetical protein [Sinorhizobium sp. RAC02]|uniref:hypothetical protein n=1 Tax=Sinorhizobium sp. RAC02 TaxID=1842534 RepID=UPI00083D4CBA|nr:hypothetical protein [Sinorhizobium sp. RAC02]AOF90042.1 hypothetical protein BSY16_14 [Sinorhizobium sp. RAC02]